jgi:eukaryotic-like serine/threonine-protein kinase
MTFDGPVRDTTPGTAGAARDRLAHLRHDLGTPLNAIIGYSEMLLEDDSAGVDAAARADLEIVRRTGRAVLSLLGEILAPSRIDAGILDGSINDVGAAIRERLRAPSATLGSATARLLDLPGAAERPGWGADLHRIRAATLQFGALLDGLVVVDLETGEDGPDREATKPLASPDAADSMAGEQTISRAASAPVGRPRARLLVVDDTEPNRDILSRILGRHGHDVTAAASGRDALHFLAHHSVDLVLLDILMPEMNGFELLRRLKDDEGLRQVPVIFISALDDTDGKVQAFRAGGVDYVTKPFQAEEVVARVENQLQISRLQTNLARQNEELLRKNEELVRAQLRTDLVFSALADALPGTVLDGKYRLEEKIGAGGFGAVFRGTHLGLDLPVAIKVFRPMVGNDTPDALERFRQEGIAASRIRHPNAVEILDNGISATGIAYLVMELMHGRTLDTELKQLGTLSLDRTAEILIPVCEALADVHAAGIVHRDISPSNIYLHQGKRGEVVKLLDFGLSKMLGAACDATQPAVTITGSLAGTPAYMAPERFTGSVCDGRSDVYSLGVIMYRMLSGRPPFDPGDGGQFAIAMLHLTADPPPLPPLGADVPAELDPLVRRTMARDPAQRPTAAELAALLRALVPPRGETRNPG